MYDGLTFSSVEAAYQVQKILCLEEREKFTHYSAYMARYVGRREKGMRSDWDTVKLRIMEELVRYKSQYQEYIALLCDTYPKELVEGNTWGDQFYGVTEDGIGENHLGKIFMKVREEVIGEGKQIWK